MIEDITLSIFALVLIIGCFALVATLWGEGTALFKKKTQPPEPDEIIRKKKVEARKYNILEKARLIIECLGDGHKGCARDGLTILQENRFDSYFLTIRQGRFVVFEAQWPDDYSITSQETDHINFITSYFAGPWLDRLDSLYSDAQRKVEEQKEQAAQRSRAKFGL